MQAMEAENRMLQERNAGLKMKMMSVKNETTNLAKLRVDKLKGKLGTALNDVQEAHSNNLQLQDMVNQAKSLQTIADLRAETLHSYSFEDLKAIVESDRAANETENAYSYSFEDLKAVVESDRAAIEAEVAQSQKFLSHSFEDLKGIEELNVALKDQNEKLKRSVNNTNHDVLTLQTKVISMEVIGLRSSSELGLGSWLGSGWG